MRKIVLSLPVLLLTACADDFVPREKVARYDAETGGIEYAYPCPDWSHSSIANYDNSFHSNYGCAVNNNLAVQLANPEDLDHGRASAESGSPDTETTARVIERYRAGEIPAPLVPAQAAGSE